MVGTLAASPSPAAAASRFVSHGASTYRLFARCPIPAVGIAPLLRSSARVAAVLRFSRVLSSRHKEIERRQTAPEGDAQAATAEEDDEVEPR